MQQSIDPSMRLPLRICILAFLSTVATLTLMRLRNLILLQERRRPWVQALVTAPKERRNDPAFSSAAAFLAMGGYALYVWLAVAATLLIFGFLTLHTCWQRRALFRELSRQQARSGVSSPLATVQKRRAAMQTRRKTRLGIALAVLVGLGLTIGLTLYALSANIDLSTPGRSCMAKRKPISGHITASACGLAATFSPAASSVTRRARTSVSACTTPAGWWKLAIGAFCRICSARGRGGSQGCSMAIGTLPPARCWRSTMRTIRRRK